MATTKLRRFADAPRRRQTTPAEQEEMRRLRAMGLTYTAIGRLFGRDRSVIRLILDPTQRQATRDRAWWWRVRNWGAQNVLGALHRAEHRDEHLADCRFYYHHNRERELQKAAQWRLANPDYGRKWHAEHRDEINTRQRKARAENPERFRAYDRKRRRNGNTSIPA